MVFVEVFIEGHYVYYYGVCHKTGFIIPHVFSSEFQPGVPWKGIDRVDPESDPYMTPGSMMGNAVSPNLNDTEHQLLQDNTGKHLTASLPHFSCHKPCDDTTVEQQYLTFSEFALLSYGISYHVAQGKIFLSFFDFLSVFCFQKFACI